MEYNGTSPCRSSSSHVKRFYPLLVHRRTYLATASFRPRLTTTPLHSLGLHLHQAGQRTFTSFDQTCSAHPAPAAKSGPLPRNLQTVTPVAKNGNRRASLQVRPSLSLAKRDLLSRLANGRVSLAGSPRQDCGRFRLTTAFPIPRRTSHPEAGRVAPSKPALYGIGR